MTKFGALQTNPYEDAIRFFDHYHLRRKFIMTEVIVWSGWAGGLAVGLFALLLLLVSGKHLGVSTGYGNFCGFISRVSFFHKGEYATLNNWRLWFIIGLPLGGLLAAATSPGGVIPGFSLGAMYDMVLPSTLWTKGFMLLVSGMMIGYGARMAGGCQSGHAIMGTSLLNPASFIAAAGFFVGGLIAVQILFRFLI